MRVLFVKQDHASPSGLIGDAFASLGWDVSEIVVVPESRYHSPDVTVEFPSASSYDAVVFYGAPWSVYDTDRIGSWIGDEIGFARSAIASGVPVLGICFGGQMLAAAVGGSVSLAPAPEIGWISVAADAASADASGLIEAGPWLAWHFDRFTVPACVPVLARTELAIQAFCVGRVLGLQFHPEVNVEVLESWLSIGGYDQLSGLNIDVGPLLAGARLGRDGAAARARELVRRFAVDVARRPVVVPGATVLTPAR